MSSYIIQVGSRTLTETGKSMKEAMGLAELHCKVRFGQAIDWLYTLQEAKEMQDNTGIVNNVSIEVFKYI